MSENSDELAGIQIVRATHSGELKVGGTAIECYVLEDGRRVLARTHMLAAMNMSPGGPGRTGHATNRLLRFTQGKIIAKHLDEEAVALVSRPVMVERPDGAMTDAYEAVLLRRLCSAVLAARRAGELQAQQAHIAVACEILNDGFADVGLIALVDEATGYQYERARTALAEILEAFVAKALAGWVKTFPDEFYRQMFRLRGLEVDDIRKRPAYFGHLTNDVVYSRLAPGVLDELREKNPAGPEGQRDAKHHQWLTRDTGHPKLREHLIRATTLMQVSNDWDGFILKLDKVAPRFGDTLQLPLPDEDG